MTIYRLEDDLREPLRWCLRAPTNEAADDFTWAFNVAKAARPTLPLFARLRRRGRPVDYTLADFDIPILSSAAMMLFRHHAREHVQFFPVRIEGESDEYFVMNILTEADCLDETASEIQWWTEGHRTERYRMIVHEVYDRRVTDLPPIFRLSNFHVAVLVTDELRQAINQARLTGMVLREIPSNQEAEPAHPAEPSQSSGR